MATEATKLTKRAVDALRPKTARYAVHDSEVPGFVVRVTPNGAKSFGLFYRAGSGRGAPKRMVTLGSYGALTVEQARQQARLALADVLGGGDPATVRAGAKDAPTVAKLGVDYLADVDVRRKKRTAAEYRRQWVKHVVPVIGTKRVADVTDADVAKLHRSLKKTPYLANRVVALVGAFFTYAEGEGARSMGTNPAHGIEDYKERARERFLTQDEIERLGDALRRAEREGLPPAPVHRKRKTGPTAKHRPRLAYALKPANPFAVAAIRFLLLSGWREQEALTLTWAELSSERGTATLEDTKADRSQRAIGAPAWLILSDLPRIEGSPYVFPGWKKGRPLADVARLWYAVRHATGLESVRLHDLRHTFASVTASAGGSLLMIGKLLGHKQASTTMRYAHLADSPVKVAADSTAGQVAAWLGGSTSPVPTPTLRIVAK